jgi:uracil-DNA glycosylase
VMATIHPSSILRAPDEDARRTELARFVEDLAAIAEALRRGAPGPEPAPPAF